MNQYRAKTILNLHANDAAMIIDAALNLILSRRYSCRCPFVSCCDDGGGGGDASDFECRSIDGVNGSFDLMTKAMDRIVAFPHSNHF